MLVVVDVDPETPARAAAAAQRLTADAAAECPDRRPGRREDRPARRRGHRPRQRRRHRGPTQGTDRPLCGAILHSRRHPTMTYSQLLAGRAALESRALSYASASCLARSRSVTLECPRCRAELPDVAHFCHVCGQDLRSEDLTRRRSFAAKPDEPVASFALISSIMPRGAGQRPQTYRIALTIALVVALIAAIFGALPIAVLVAAFAIPIVYIVYLYDVNLWEDEPIPVTGLAFGLTGVLTIGFTILWTWSACGRCRPAPRRSTARPRARRPACRHLPVGRAGRADRRRGDPADRSGAAGQPARVRRPDGRSDLRGDQRGLVRLLRHPGPALGSADRRPGGGRIRACGCR